MVQETAAICITGLKTKLGSTLIHNGIDLTINQGEIMAIVGGSGSGKTTLLREIIMLQKPIAGSITVLGHDVINPNLETAHSLQLRWGVLFQASALFSSLTVLENVAFPLKEQTLLSDAVIRDLALLKIELVGLEADAAEKFPSELSGGMKKRAGLARAIALDPELLFLDEPTAGLDPESADAFSTLILKLRATLNLTVVMITHDLDTLWQIADRIAFLGHQRLLGIGDIATLCASSVPMIHDYFNGPRGRAAQAQAQADKNTCTRD